MNPPLPREEQVKLREKILSVADSRKRSDSASANDSSQGTANIQITGANSIQVNPQRLELLTRGGHLMGSSAQVVRVACAKSAADACSPLLKYKPIL